MYKSNGDFVTGEPVKILLYLAILANDSIALVLLADGFFIVVDSSISTIVLLQFINFLANSIPFLF